MVPYNTEKGLRGIACVDDSFSLVVSARAEVFNNAVSIMSDKSIDKIGQLVMSSQVDKLNSVREKLNDGTSLRDVTVAEVPLHAVIVTIDELSDEISEAMVNSNADER
jgi:hypothetical protein